MKTATVREQVRLWIESAWGKDAPATPFPPIVKKIGISNGISRANLLATTGNDDFKGSKVMLPFTHPAKVAVRTWRRLGMSNQQIAAMIKAE